MRHANRTKKFGREKNERKALLRTLASSLIRHGRIRTTEAKAKALRPFVERIVTLSKLGTIASRRLVYRRLGSASSRPKLYADLVPKFSSRQGGYTRIVKAGFRTSDGARMAIIEFV